jgi:hypothetical protein
VPGAEAAADVEPVEPRHDEVEEDRVGAAARDARERLDPVGGLLDVVAGRLERAAQDRAVVGVVVRDEDGAAEGEDGRRRLVGRGRRDRRPGAAPPPAGRAFAGAPRKRPASAATRAASTGFATKASMPAAKQRSRSSRVALAVTATIGTEAGVPPSRAASPARTRRDASKPSISGSWQSMKTRP